MANETISVPFTGSIPLAGTVTGTFTGILTANVINFVTGEIAGNFTGTGIAVTPLGDEVTGDVNAVVSGKINCKRPDDFLSDCGVTLDCPAGVEYPYKFCIDGKIQVACTDDPLTFKYLSAGGYTIPIKAQLPIRPYITGYSKGMEYFFECHHSVGGIQVITPLFGNPMGPLHYHNIFDREVLEAAEKWNCVCGMQGTQAAVGTLIRMEFTDNREKFPNPYTSIGIADGSNSKPKMGTDEEGNITCSIDYDVATIYFNSSPEFLYELPDFPAKKNTPLKNGWVGQDFIPFLDPPYAPPQSPTLTLFSFMQVAMHEIGHMLGFGHYGVHSMLTPNCGDDESGIMRHYVDDIRDPAENNNITELSLYDKCMMAKLYCPDLVVGIEEKTERPYINVVPNPTTGEINITFEVKSGTKSVTIGLYDEQGRTLKTLLSETIYSEGLHICNSRLDFLPSGMYFLRIEIGNISYFEKIIIAR